MDESIYNLRIKYADENHPSLLIDQMGGLKAEDLICLQADMLSAHKIPGYLPFAVETFNLDVSLHYDLSDVKSLANYIEGKGLSVQTAKEYYLMILSILRSRSKYMLDPNRYVLSLSYVFINSGDNELFLIYLPLKKIPEKPQLNNELKQLFINLFKMVKGVELNFYNDIIEYFSDADFQLMKLAARVESVSSNCVIREQAAQEIYPAASIKQEKVFRWFSKLQSMKIDKKGSQLAKIESVVVNDDCRNKELIDTCKLIADNPLFKLERHVNGQVETIGLEQKHFVIGRNKCVVHYYEASNDISRVHLEIIRDLSGYLIRDLDSKNGSYLNGIKLTPNKLYPVVVGDRIQLANIEYYVKKIPDKEGDSNE